jgi:hypothetical protein
MGTDNVRVDDELRRWLNLVHGSPGFAFSEAADGTWELVSVAMLARDSGRYIVAGITKLQNGRQLESAFMVDSAGGELAAVYWKTDSGWIESSDACAALQLNLNHSELFPFDWELAIPLEFDAYHS